MEKEFTAILTEDNRLLPNMYNIEFNPITFFKEVDWTEPWLIGLLFFHVLIITLTVITRHYGTIQGIFFLILLSLVFSAQYINEVAANNWKYFSRHQYFDSHGMFISIVFSSPLLINCLIMVGRWLYISGCMTIKIKQAQLRERMRAESRARKQQSNSEGERLSRKSSRSGSKLSEQNGDTRPERSGSGTKKDHLKGE